MTTKTKIHIGSSIILAVFVMMPSMLQHPKQTSAFLIFSIVAAIPIYAFFSLSNIRSKNMKFFYFSFLIIAFCFLIYRNFIVGNWAFDKAIVVSVLTTGVMAMVFRGFAWLREFLE